MGSNFPGRLIQAIVLFLSERLSLSSRTAATGSADSTEPSRIEPKAIPVEHRLAADFLKKYGKNWLLILSGSG